MKIKGTDQPPSPTYNEQDIELVERPATLETAVQTIGVPTLAIVETDRSQFLEEIELYAERMKSRRWYALVIASAGLVLVVIGCGVLIGGAANRSPKLLFGGIATAAFGALIVQITTIAHVCLK